MSSREGAVAGPVVSLLSSRLTPLGLKWSSVLTPPTRLAEASKPSAGRLKALCSRWYMPIRLIAPRSPRLYRGGQPQDRGRSHGEEPLLLEPGGDLGRTGSEERVGIEEGHLAQVVGDGVVHPSLQPAPAHGELLAALPDLKGTEVQGGAVPAPVELYRRRIWNLADGLLSRR